LEKQWIVEVYKCAKVWRKNIHLIEENGLGADSCAGHEKQVENGMMGNRLRKFLINGTWY